ncbi:MAG: F0F1 ATP synthase subunit B [Gammaproteobacteria bacterium]|nr:F0F1 ATP synthase subunit B [Gammaproteobacteria bacterium]NIR30349.1 F0F1 ATP synthase subunit B [Gammaproteobacteria bacterium]NIR98193.1 F0F1 ATP synthase subunit B [Gammaproteobacteria bacterium]NIT63860.1 F0F1 ATP synthase subunit B [Gammaproteobacteria bacterium]NIV20864.1 F0F1 ATP synthase subunit B [Gammaproteobacteria bacterium]
MQIDWVTVAAQIANFLVLVYLLKRLLYQPVITAMEARERRIAERLNEAERHEEEAEREGRAYRDKADSLDRRRDELIRQAEQEAEARRRELLEQARGEVDDTRAQWQQEIEREQRDFLTALRARAAESISAIARRALHDLADAELEEQIVQAFLSRLAGLDERQREAIGKASGPLRVVTSFELTGELRQGIAEAVHEHLSAGREIHFEQAGELVAGIELRTEGRKLGWSIDQYLETLEAQLRGLLQSAVQGS